MCILIANNSTSFRKGAHEMIKTIPFVSNYENEDFKKKSIED